MRDALENQRHVSTERRAAALDALPDSRWMKYRKYNTVGEDDERHSVVAKKKTIQRTANEGVPI